MITRLVIAFGIIGYASVAAAAEAPDIRITNAQFLNMLAYGMTPAIAAPAAVADISPSNRKFLRELSQEIRPDASFAKRKLSNNQ